MTSQRIVPGTNEFFVPSGLLMPPAPGAATPPSQVSYGADRKPPRPPSGMVTFWAEAEGPITAILMETPESDRAVGGYEDFERPGQGPVSSFKSTPNSTLTLKLRLQHGLTTQESVNDDMDALEEMGRPQQAGKPPGGLWIIGEVPFKTTDLLKIDSLQLGERRYFSGSRRRRWQMLTLTLSPLTLPKVVNQATPRRTRDAKGKRRIRTIKTKSGDTLRYLATAELGNPARWTDLKAWNAHLKRVDPDARLRPGTKVQVR